MVSFRFLPIVIVSNPLHRTTITITINGSPPFLPLQYPPPSLVFPATARRLYLLLRGRLNRNPHPPPPACWIFRRLVRDGVGRSVRRSIAGWGAGVEQGVLVDGVVTTQEKDELAKWRREMGVNEETHAVELKAAGWSLQEFDQG